MVGKLIVMEGLDGSGKSTQTKLLVEHLKKKGFQVHLTNEPSDKGLRKIIKDTISTKSKIDDPILDALLYTSDRRFHLKSEILPLLEQNFIVISDRYYHSTFTYQQAQGLDLDWLIDINKFSLKPNLTIIIDSNPEKALERISKENRQNIAKFEKLEFLKKLRGNYLNLPEKLKDEKIIIIDGDRPREEVFGDIKKIVERHL